MIAGGLILCGGGSVRFGSEKAMVRLEGRPMIAFVAEVLERGCAKVAAAAPTSAGAAAWSRSRGIEVIADAHEPGLGPLFGVLAGLRWAAAEKMDLLVTAPCDVPRLPPGLVAALAGAAGEAMGAVAVDAHGAVQPLCAAWRLEALAHLETALAHGRHPAVRDLIGELRFGNVRFDEPGAFANINTPAELRDAKRMESG